METKYTGKTAFLHLGFRPFFFAGISFGLISIALWLAIYTFGKGLLPSSYPLFSWHAHEMIFGFTLAIITGFLLTAVKNWTGIQTINGKPLLGLLALALVILHGARLYGWYHKAIWKKSLLWVLLVGYSWIVIGFILKFAAAFMTISPFLALHAFAYGGIGMITSGMMARVSLGHTGNNVFEPPKILNLIFALLFAGAVVRVILPLFLNQFYIHLIGLSQVLWILAFLIFFVVYAPMLIKARIDGRPG